jgi:hypothetical protein
VFKFLNGDVYQGQFVAGEQSGTGTLIHRNGIATPVPGSKDMRDGKGVAEWKDGQRYEGDWRANRKEGQGVMRFADGGSYDGAWVNDRAVGQGAPSSLPPATPMRGEVRDGLPQGKGVCIPGVLETSLTASLLAVAPQPRGVMTFYIPPQPRQWRHLLRHHLVRHRPKRRPLPPAAVSRLQPCVRVPTTGPRNVAALKKFMEPFRKMSVTPQRWQRQKIAALEENERKIGQTGEDREAQAKALVGLPVAYRQDFTHCVGPQGKCQNVTYSLKSRARYAKSAWRDKRSCCR